jgi:hypothetical protein
MGAYESEYPVGIEENISGLPHSYVLLQNYPNPFNPTTTIEFAVPRSSYVTLKVFNVLSQEVATLVDDVKDPGTYETSWDASSMASGVYFYRMKAGDPSVGSGQSFVDTKKLLLLR